MRYREFAIEEKKTIASVVPVSADKLSKSEIKKAYSKLSAVELAQLGTPGYISYEDWPRFRRFLVERSLASNPSLDPKYTAYTPGETLHLLNDPVISAWHREIISYVVPTRYSMVAFVPCAKTKPWAGASKGLYKSYNKLINDNRYPVYFVTVSEPLGIVPQSLWSDFPQYDNPGLFKDNVQRTGGMFTSDWARLFGTGQQKIPFDGEAYIKCVTALSSVIKQFIQHNSSKKFLSFVEDKKFNPKTKNVGTHSDMLSRTGSIPDENRLLKRAKSRAEPYDYIDAELNSRMAQQEPEDDRETKEVKLNEEISLGKYAPKFKSAILDAVTDALKNIKRNYLEKWGVWEEEKEEYKVGKTEALDKKIKDILTQGALKSIQYIENLAKQIEPRLKSVQFGTSSIGSAGLAAAAASDTDIKMRKDYYEQIADKLYDLISETVMKNYKRYEKESLFNGLIITIDDAIESGCRGFLNNNKLNSYLDFQAEIFVHELTHIVQNARRSQKLKKDKSYRSYLEKDRGEYHMLNIFRGMNALSPEEEKRFFHLYYASPEEIGAYAHNIALDIFRKYHLSKTGNSKESYIINAKKALHDIPRVTNEYIGKEYAGSSEPKIQAVYKRYQKFAYKELYDLIQDTLKTANFKE
jgi:hypothetical protein